MQLKQSTVINQENKEIVLNKKLSLPELHIIDLV
jgi:hypothetical protein